LEFQFAPKNRFALLSLFPKKPSLTVDATFAQSGVLISPKGVCGLACKLGICRLAWCTLILGGNLPMFSAKSFLAGVITGLAVAFLVWAGIHDHRVKAARAQLYTPLSETPPLQFPDVHNLPASSKPDPNWAFKGLDGKEFTLADFRGKALFLDFWATWCNDCAAEMHYIQNLQDELKGAPVAFALVSAETPSTLQRFVADEHLSLPVYTAVGKPPSALETYGLPTTYILSPTGELVYRRVGEAKWDDASCVNFLRQLAPSSAAGPGGS
jgi:thiol-disulfide isomerase/thioredoxin